MSDEPTKYVLRKAITAELKQRFGVESDEYSYWHIPVGDGYKLDTAPEVFERLFVPVSDLSRENQPEPTPLNDGICVLCGEKITINQDAVAISGIGLRHSFDCNPQNQPSVASENLKQQLETLLKPFIFMSSQEGYYYLEDNELFKKLNGDNDTKVIVERILELIQRSKE